MPKINVQFDKSKTKDPSPYHWERASRRGKIRKAIEANCTVANKKAPLSFAMVQFVYCGRIVWYNYTNIQNERSEREKYAYVHSIAK